MDLGSHRISCTFWQGEMEIASLRKPQGREEDGDIICDSYNLKYIVKYNVINCQCFFVCNF